ncbi:MAG: hypothetical protein ACT4OY_04250, partial [Alphaproteobacteria bacterium]
MARSKINTVIARSHEMATRQSTFKKDWIASLALAMTNKFIPVLKFTKAVLLTWVLCPLVLSALAVFST